MFYIIAKMTIIEMRMHQKAIKLENPCIDMRGCQHVVYNNENACPFKDLHFCYCYNNFFFTHFNDLHFC